MAKTKNFSFRDEEVLRRRGAYWLIIAANLGYSEAQAQLASSYEYGQNDVRIDKVAAAYWSKRVTGELVPGRNDYEYENYYVENLNLTVREKRARVEELEKLANINKFKMDDVFQVPNQNKQVEAKPEVQEDRSEKPAPVQEVRSEKPAPVQVIIPEKVEERVEQPEVTPVQQVVQVQPETKSKYDLSKPPVDIAALRKQAQSGNPKSQVALARELVKDTQTAEEAFELFNKAAGLGLSDALYEIAECYLQGLGTAQDTDKGLKSLNDAIAKQNGKAISKLADLKLEGKVLPKNTEAAWQEFNDAAKKGDPYGMFRVGHFLSNNNLGVEKDLVKAAEWWEKAAALKEPNAQCQLSLFYYYGKGGKAVDKEKSLALLIESAREGNAIAKSMLEKLFS